MSWIIVGVVAAILVANLFKLMPRGRIMHIQRLREEARKLGYRVERQLQADHNPLLEHCVGYRRSLARCPLSSEFSCQRTDTGWIWLLGSAESSGAQPVLDALPAGIRRIDRQSFSVLVFWIEPQTLEPLTELDQALALLPEAGAV
ncbi:hypothetical protein [Halopseudomonas pelagia]|uniref:hypothetical protein n=1 Tax=Halopseudomonas pelagia TaxID=553151 RepID=UPI0003B3CF9F|nr:hypothetical protein [Halopseudomonas pelagia]|tara:strand:- start:3414 stop:3851 length:438 start_codon:yes stop_codon:yes gene_type:complete